MHNLLEQYLGEVAAHLTPLPVARRQEELKELRGHLESAYGVSHEEGMSDEAAAHVVLAQFGQSSSLGEKLVWAWRRERRAWWLNFLAAALGYYALGLAFVHVEHGISRWIFGEYFHTLPPMFIPTMWTMCIGCAVLTGGVIGALFPKRAVMSAILLVLLLKIPDVLYGDIVSPFHDHERGIFFALTVISGIVFSLLGNGVPALVGAKVSGHWRERRLLRVQQ